MFAFFAVVVFFAVEVVFFAVVVFLAAVEVVFFVVEAVEVVDETEEFDVFTLEIDGVTKDWAILEEFEFENKTYIVCAEVLGDELSDEGLYLFEGTSEGDGDVPISEDDIDQLGRCLDITVTVEKWNVILVTPEF